MIRRLGSRWWAIVGLLGMIAVSVAAPGIVDPIPIVEPGADAPAGGTIDEAVLAEYGLAAEPEARTGPGIPPILLAIGLGGTVLVALAILSFIVITEVRRSGQVRNRGLGALLLIGIIATVTIGVMRLGPAVLGPGVLELIPVLLAVVATVLALLGAEIVITSTGSRIESVESPESPPDTGRQPDSDPTSDHPTRRTGDAAKDSNPIFGAWRRFATTVEPDVTGPATPRRILEAALERGMDEAAVRSLTELFEAARYGTGPITAPDERRAERLADRLCGGDDA